MRLQLNGGTKVSLARLQELIRSGDVTVAKGTFVQDGNRIVVTSLDCEASGVLDISDSAVGNKTTTEFQRMMEQGS